MKAAARALSLILALQSASIFGLPALKMEKARSQVSFHAASTHAAVKINGELREGTFLSGAIVQMGHDLTGSILVPMDAFDTGIDLRTQHMKDKYLETAKYPNAELVLEALRLPEGVEKKRQSVPFTATMKLHGWDKKVAGTASVWRENGSLGLELEFPIRLSDYAIARPGFLGVELKDEVKVKASVVGPLDEIIL